VIQRYALKAYLQKKGYNFDAVKFSDWSDEVKNTASIKEFVDQKIGGRYFDPDKLQGYKNYVVGSDQVWRNWYGGDWNRFAPFFLTFVNDKNKTNRVSYAASFGVDNLAEAGINESNAEKIQPFLDKFDSISVREKSGVGLIKEIIGRKNKNIKTTIDPTLLLTADDYSSLVNDSRLKNKSMSDVFCYILDENYGKMKIIKDVAKHYGNSYEIIGLSGDKKYEPVEKWLKGFRDSKFVITDSFHGLAFSILNNKDFIVFANPDRGMTRFESLFDSFGIPKDRLVFADSGIKVDVAKLDPIDWEKVNNNLKRFRNDSEKWLQNSLKGRRKIIRQRII
jgi:hypothetical protein